MSDFAPRTRPELLVGGYDRFDATVQFYQRLRSLLQKDCTVLDFGAGGGTWLADDCTHRRNMRLLRGTVREVIGADVDPRVQNNRSLDRAVMISSDGRIPLRDASVDIIVSDWTFEHIADPETVALEFSRVLKPGGWICARTPNRRGYVATANLSFPTAIGDKIVRILQPDRNPKDKFPAVYRMNTQRALLRLFPQGKFRHVAYTWDPSPAYHGNSIILFHLMCCFHWLTPAPLRSLLMIFIQKRP